MAVHRIFLIPRRPIAYPLIAVQLSFFSPAAPANGELFGIQKPFIGLLHEQGKTGLDALLRGLVQLV